MQAFTSVFCSHDAAVHDLAFDWYGNRLATCSSDQRLKVWDHVNGKWSCTAEIKAHSGSVHALSWAHPEFGQLLASCSSDRAVHIYEEQVDGRTGARAWKKQGRLVDSRDSVQDCAFAPRHLGLRLATCSLDGRVRIYESNDVMNLSVWPLVEEIEAAKGNCSALSWNTSPFDPPMLCVAAERDVRVWEYNGNARRWTVAATLDGHTDLVHDVAWAPNLGRAYHLLATACKDQAVRIYRLGYNKATQTYVPQLVAKLQQHGAEVWRVSWNVAGTILASTGDDGVSRLWKADFNGTWHPVLVAAATPAPASLAAAQNQSNGGVGNAAASSATAPNLNRLQSAPNNAQPQSSSQQQATPQQQQASVNTHATLPFSGGLGAAGYKTAPQSFGAPKRSDEVKFSDHRSFN